MNCVIRNATVFYGGCFQRSDIRVDGSVVADVAPTVAPVSGEAVFDYNNCYIFPGFSDVHVHLREPGFSYKETIRDGTAAAAHGGYTAVCTMPNLDPVPDSKEHLAEQLLIINKDACIDVFPYGAITVGRKGRVLSDMDETAADVVAFSDDGSGVQDDNIMRQAMLKARSLGKIIAAHCEDNSLLNGGYIHDGAYAREHGHAGISSESEWRQIERDLRLAEETGCAYHVCHISTAESVQLIREAKKQGIDVTCETAPHYLVLDDSDLGEEGRFKMNPPLRAYQDKQALLAGLADGTIDMIATDHAPHSAAEKGCGLKASLMGVTGLETAFPVLYTSLVKTGVITLEKLMELMVLNPAKRFGVGNELKPGKSANLCVWNLEEKYNVDPADFLSKGKSTPFSGMPVYGKCKMTMSKGGIVWKETSTER